MSMDRPTIVDLFGKDKLEEIQQKIGKATGLAFVTVDYTGEPITETTCFSKYCEAVRGGKDSCECCKKSDAFGALQAAITRKPCVYFCPCGLLEVAIPIEDKGAFIGGFIGGQILCEDAPESVPVLAQLFKQDDEIISNEEMLKLKEKTKKYSYSQFMDIVNLVHLIISQLCEHESSNIENSESLKKEKEVLDAKKHKLELQAELLEQKVANLMMNQNQYFLMNTLSSISGMATLEEATLTNEYILEFAEFMKNSIKSPEEYWTLEEELEHVERYLKLAGAKIKDRFTYSIRMKEKMRNRKVLVYMLLPYVENAMYYGIALTKEPARLEINTYLEDGEGYIEITENGPGYKEEEILEKYSKYKGQHEGKYIDNVIMRMNSRLCDEYGKEYKPIIEVLPGEGRIIKMKMPRIISGGIDND